MADWLKGITEDKGELARLWAAKEAACPVTHAHEIGVGMEVKALSRFLGYDRVTSDDFARCGAFHDVGKMLIPRDVLWKPTVLTIQEMELVKRHAENGALMLAKVPGMISDIGADMAHYHHERPDGLGYHGLKAGGIPPQASICAVADVYEAMTSSHRPYKVAFSPGDVLGMMVREAPGGKLGAGNFDRSVLRSFAVLKFSSLKAELQPAEKDLLRDFIKSGEPSRKADIAAFKAAMRSFMRDGARDPALADRRAAAIRKAAESDPEKGKLFWSDPCAMRVIERADAAARAQAKRKRDDLVA